MTDKKEESGCVSAFMSMLFSTAALYLLLMFLANMQAEIRRLEKKHNLPTWNFVWINPFSDMKWKEDVAKANPEPENNNAK